MMKLTEVWICYSTISFYLFCSWQRVNYRTIKGFVCYAPGSPLHTCLVPNDWQIESKKHLKIYCAKTFIHLALRCLLSGKRLVVRVPHLNPPIISKTIKRLQKLGLISLEIYDDGFLGILDQPSVCDYLQPIFHSICCWNIAGWSLSNYSLGHIQTPKIKRLVVYPSPCKHLIDDIFRLKANEESTNQQSFILEAKYMDYSLLKNLLITNKLDDYLAQPPYYYQHPWSIKRNKLWPTNISRNQITHLSVERHLASLITEHSHIITGMTSSIVLICELVNQGLLPKPKITLLLLEPTCSTEYHNPLEVKSFINFLKNSYSHSHELEIWLNGVTL